MVATSESLRVAARDRELSVPIHRPQAHRSAPGAWTTAVLCTGYPPTARGTRWSASAAGNNGRPDCPLVRHRRSRVVPGTRRLRPSRESKRAKRGAFWGNMSAPRVISRSTARAQMLTRQRVRSAPRLPPSSDPPLCSLPRRRRRRTAPPGCADAERSPGLTARPCARA